MTAEPRQPWQIADLSLADLLKRGKVSNASIATLNCVWASSAIAPRSIIPNASPLC